MVVGFTVMFATGFLLFYAIPVRTSQSLWFRIKVVLLIAAALNAWLFHRRMLAAPQGWDAAPRAPLRLQVGAALSLLFWVLVVICGRFIAYDWFDCQRDPSPIVAFLAGCIDGQKVF